MAPDIRQYVEIRQTIAVTSTASPIVVRTTLTLNLRRHEVQESSVSIRTHTYRTNLNLSVIVEDMTMEANLQPPQQLALRDKKLFVVQDAFLAQFIQIT